MKNRSQAPAETEMIVYNAILFAAHSKQDNEADHYAANKKKEGKPQGRAGQKIINDVPIHNGTLMYWNFVCLLSISGYTQSAVKGRNINYICPICQSGWTTHIDYFTS